MKKIFLIALAFILMPAAWAEAPVFRVIKRQGPIFVKGPQELAWHRLEAKMLPLGTLIRIDREGSIELAVQKSALRPHELTRKIQLRQPLITRLDEEVVRRIEVEDYPLRDLWETGSESYKAPKDLPLLSFASSFIRSMVSLDHSPKLPPLDIRDEPPAVAVGASMQEFRILSPNEGSLFFLSAGQTSVPVVWETPEDGLVYHLYVWSSGELRNRPLFTGKESWFQLQIEKVGDYKIQIEDSTRRYRSKALVITIDRPLSLLSSEDRRTKESPLREILPLHPYPRSTLTLASDQTQQIFAWEDRVGLEADEYYRLIVSKEGGKTKRYTTKKLSFSLRLDAGRYTWFVQKFGPNRKKTPAVSDSRLLILQKNKSPLSSLIGNSPSQTIYFDLK